MQLGQEVPKPPTTNKRISSLELMAGQKIHPLKILEMMSDQEFEVFILEWVDGFLGKEYKQVRRLGGAGDKGRDIVGFKVNGEIDIFQCKHYQKVLAPTDIYVEFGKVCHYSYIKDYPIPTNYYIISPKGLGPTLSDLISKPEILKKQLIQNWKKNVEGEITKEPIPLTGGFKKYVEDFDFSIVRNKEPHEIINEHAMTRYHTLRFGLYAMKFRSKIPKAEKEVHKRELKYVTKLLDVYSDKLSKAIKTATELQSVNLDLHQHFNDQRNSFYSAESLEVFSRENFAEVSPLPFDELKEEIDTIIRNSLLLCSGKSGFERMLSAILDAQKADYSSNVLKNEMKVQDKQGICHHLANDDKIKSWIEKK
jgi:hypothetical protein